MVKKRGSVISKYKYKETAKVISRQMETEPNSLHPEVNDNLRSVEELVCVTDDREKLLKMSEISLWLDCYDDIFSDFDSRPYTHRALSVDFLDEAKRATLDKNSTNIELRFLIPHKMRNYNMEEEIKHRLHEHFQKHHNMLLKDTKKVKMRGGIWFVLGVFLLVFSGFLYTYAEHTEFKLFAANLGMNILILIFEPAGWFLAWEGLDQVFFESRHKKPEVDFYEKMSRAEVHFMSY